MNATPTPGFKAAMEGLVENAPIFQGHKPGTQAPPEPLLRRVSIADVISNPSPAPGFVWDGYLPRDTVSILGAHGGTGKSTIALMLAVCVALGRPLFGVDTVPGRALFVSLEDPVSVTRHRLRSICSAMGIDPTSFAEKLVVVDGTAEPELMAADGQRSPMVRTGTCHELSAMAAGFDLVVIDNASDAFGGDEVQRRQVRTFMRALRVPGCAVLLLAHVDKATIRARNGEGGESYSGSTAWHNSARSRLFLSRNDSGLLKLEHQKSNFCRMRQPITLRWPEDGLPHLTSADVSTGHASKADDERAAQLLCILAEFETREQYASPAPQARNNVFALLRSEPTFNRLKLTPDDTKRIVTQCHRAGWLDAIDYKSAHTRKYCQRWTVAPAGRLFAGLPAAPTAPTAPTCHDLAQGAEGAGGAHPQHPHP